MCGSDHQTPPLFVFLSPFTSCASSSLGLWIRPSALSGPVMAERKHLDWMSVQGLTDRAVASPTSWTSCFDTCSPLESLFIVCAVFAVALKAKNAREISRLQRSVRMKDQMLSRMQLKLGGLFRSVSDEVDQHMKVFDVVPLEDCLSGVMDLHPETGIPPIRNLRDKKEVREIQSSKDETLKDSILHLAEQEERRMSDLSDLCSSASTTLEIQLTALATEQDYYNIRKECEEKDVTIKELSSALHNASVSNSQRVMELEEIIKKKNMEISNIKKDKSILEQQVIKLIRLRRPSFEAASSNLPIMTNNIAYDMSSTSPSSSDSDILNERKEGHSPHSVPTTSILVKDGNNSELWKLLSHKNKDMNLEISRDRARRRRSTGIDKESAARLHHSADSAPMPITRRLRPSSYGEFKKSRPFSLEPKSSATVKRWV